MSDYYYFKYGGIFRPTANVDLGSSTNQFGNVFIQSNLTVGDTTVNETTLAAPRIGGINYVGDNTATNISGGETLSINGFGFREGASVVIDGSVVSIVSVVSSSLLTFIAPPKSAGTYTLYVVNPDGGTAISLVGIQYSGVPTWTTSAGSLGSVYETQLFDTTVSATGNDIPIIYSLDSGNLPDGVSLTSGNGKISGTANVVNSSTTYNFSLKASDYQNQDTTRSFSITVNPDVITWNSPANNTNITQYETLGVSQTLNASSFLGKGITYTANTLPGNLTISGNTITGNLAAGVANTTSLITATSSETNKTATRTLFFTASPDVITWNSPANGTTITQYETTAVSQALSASSLLGFSVSYSANSFPTGISISGANITGTLPTTAVQANSTSLITATSATTNRTATRTINFSIQPDVVTWSSPSAGQSFSYTEGNSVNISLSASSAAGKSISYSASGLPSGLSISGSSITGTLTTFGSFSVTLTATAATTGKTATRSISFSVASAAVDAVFTTAGTYSWTVPAGVTSINALAIGGGGSSGYSNGNAGGGGGLSYTNAISVTPGETITVTVGGPGAYGSSTTRATRTGGNSSVSRGATVLVTAGGGGGSFGFETGTNSPSSGGTGTGGNGGSGAEGNSNYAGGGGGAGGYSGKGGNGVYLSVDAVLVAETGAGGGGGGGGATNRAGGGGGGVGLYGQGANGIGGSSLRPGTASDPGANARGRGGSGGSDGGGQVDRGNGGLYGGGGTGCVQGPNDNPRGQGGTGAVRILWRAGSAFPSTNVGA